MKNNNILIYGLNSYDNKGCEALLVSTASQIKKESNVVLNVATYDYKNNKEKYKNYVDNYICHRYNIDELSLKEQKLNKYYETQPFDFHNFENLYQKDVIKAIDKMDLCLSLGGDNYCYKDNNWLYAISDKAFENGTKNILFGVSLFEEIIDPILINNLKKFDIILARESLTYNALLNIVEKDRLLYGPDPAFSLEPKEVKLPSIFDKKVIGINISPLVIAEKNIINDLIELIKDLLAQEYRILLIPHVYSKTNSDLEELKKIKEAFSTNESVVLLNKKYDCRELKYIISKLDFLIAARTHASIAAYSSFVPTLVIGYSVKSKGIAKDIFGEEYNKFLISIEKVNYDILKEKVDYILSHKKDIIKTYNEKIPGMINESKLLFQNIIKRLDYLDSKYITRKELCTGCASCFNKCPQKAIEMIEDKEGFYYPEIDKEKCINCKLCKNICPINKKYEYAYDNKIYGMKNKNIEERMNSSSGGIFILFAKKILKNKGIVYGVSYDKSVKHIRITNIKDLPKIMKSKYVQSYIGDTYITVEKDLKNNKKVLFIGTPCQVEGLKNYLVNKEYDNLYCVSFVCHGVPNQKTFDKYVKENNITNYVFREKNGNGKTAYVSYVQNSNKKVSEFTANEYMNSFLKNFIIRKSCFNCEFKLGKKNTSDIIMGDFWGAEIETPEFYDENGISEIIVNSEKGEHLLKSIIKNTDYKKLKLKNIIKYNPCLKDKMPMNLIRDKFLGDLQTKSFKACYDKYVIENDFKNEIKKLNTEIQLKNDRIILLERENKILKSKYSTLVKRALLKIYRKVRK